MTDEQLDRVLASLAATTAALTAISDTLLAVAQSALLEDGGMDDGQADPLRTLDSK